MGLEVGKPLGCEVTSLKPTSLNLVPNTFTSPHVRSFVVNTTFCTLEPFVTPPVVVEGPGSS